MKKLFTLLSLLVVTTVLSAQREETLFNRNGGIRFTGVWVGTYNAFTDFGEDYNFNNGGSVMFEFNKNLLIGWAGYESDITANGQEIDLEGSDFFLGYTFNSRKVVHPLVYLQTGSGRLRLQDRGRDNIFVVQPTIGAEVNIARWFRLGVDAGYRFVSDSELPGISNADLSSPTFGLRLKFGWSWGDWRNNDDDDWDF